MSNPVSLLRQGCLRQRYLGINLRMKPHSPTEDLRGKQQLQPPSPVNRAKARLPPQQSTEYNSNSKQHSSARRRVAPRRRDPAEGTAAPVQPTTAVPVGGSSAAAPKALPSGPSGRRARRPGPAESRRGTGRAGRAASCALQPRSPRRAPAPLTCYSRCRRAAPRRRRRG